MTLDYTSPWWWRWTSYPFPLQVPKSLDWRYVIVLRCFMSTQVALFRWQLWLVWCCVKLWDKYSGRILSQFLHNLVIANRERKRQLKNEFVLSAVHLSVFCYKTLLLGFLNHLNTTFISILSFKQFFKCYVVLNGLQGMLSLSVSLRYYFVAWKPRSVVRWDRLLPQEEL